MVVRGHGLIQRGTRPLQESSPHSTERYRKEKRRMDFTNSARGVLSSALVDLPPGDEGALITSVETYSLAVPLGQTVADSTASIPAWLVPVVELRTADGRIA